MLRPPLGSVIEIETGKGFAYALYRHKHERRPRYGALLRVFHTTFVDRQRDFAWMVDRESTFNVFFPLGAALHRGLVKVAGRIDVPVWARDFPHFRGGTPDPDTGKVKVWWLWDGEKEWRVGELSAEQRALSIRGVINDTLLKARIVEGWTPLTDFR